MTIIYLLNILRTQTPSEAI